MLCGSLSFVNPFLKQYIIDLSCSWRFSYFRVDNGAHPAHLHYFFLSYVRSAVIF